MTPEQLENLAWKHSSISFKQPQYTFTLSQLDAYFNERFKLTIGDELFISAPAGYTVEYTMKKDEK